MRRYVLLALAGVALLLAVGSQLLLPRVAEQRIEDRLTEGGGSAEVTVRAVPAARLLLGDGDRIEVRGSGLDLDPLEQDPDVLDKVDGFGRVEVRLDDFRAGAFEVDGFELARDGSSPYRLSSSATTTPGALIDYGGARLGLPGASLLRGLADELLGEDREIPIELEAELESEAGRVRVVSGGGTVAGVPAGPLAELLTSVIVARL